VFSLLTGVVRSAEALTMAVLSLLCLTAGVAALTGTSPNREPSLQALLESAGGSLIVLGLTIISVELAT
jgi:hypothetical protein